VSPNLSLTKLWPFLLFLFAASFTIFAIQSGDSLMYLALARDFVLKNNWSFVDPYLYSLTNANLVWVHEYLSYVIFYGAWWVFGYAGMVLLKAILWCCIFAITLKAPPNETSRSWSWSLLWMLAVFAGSFRFIERSSIFSDLFCVLTVYLLLTNHHLTRKLLIQLSLIFFAWIQLHPGFPQGVALLAIWAAWHITITHNLKWRHLLWCGVPVATLLLNPLGLEGVLYPFRFALNEAQALKQYNFEWFPAYHRSFRFAPETLAFWCVSLVTFALFARTRAFKTLNFAFAAFAFLSAMQAVRFVPWASFAMLIAIKPWAQFRLLQHHRAFKWAIASLLLILTAHNLTFGYKSSSGERIPQLGLDPKFFPIQTLEFLRKRPISGRLYNTHDFGSFLIWEKQTPIFHHGFVTDMDFYKNEVVGIFQGQARFLELARKYNWTMLLVERNNSFGFFRAILSPLPDWKIVAEDEASYLIYYLPDSQP